MTKQGFTAGNTYWTTPEMKQQIADESYRLRLSKSDFIRMLVQQHLDSIDPRQEKLDLTSKAA